MAVVEVIRGCELFSSILFLLVERKKEIGKRITYGPGDIIDVSWAIFGFGSWLPHSPPSSSSSGRCWAVVLSFQIVTVCT
jgi:hypothetical protein